MLSSNIYNPKVRKMTNRAIKYRAYPTTEQSVMFAKTFGCCRKVYNLMLSDKIESYKSTGKFVTLTLPMPKGRGFLVAAERYRLTSSFLIGRTPS